jgi:hypothetical protein
MYFMFVGKARSTSKVLHLVTLKPYSKILYYVVKACHDKHSSLIHALINYDCKFFILLDQCYKIVLFSTGIYQNKLGRLSLKRIFSLVHYLRVGTYYYSIAIARKPVE